MPSSDDDNCRNPHLSRTQKWRRKRRRVVIEADEASSATSEDYFSSDASSASRQTADEVEGERTEVTSSPLGSSSSVQNELSDAADHSNLAGGGEGQIEAAQNLLPHVLDQEVLSESSYKSSNGSASSNDSNGLFTEDDSSESDNINEEEAITLYEGAPITVNESLIAVLSLVATHRLSGACILDILKLVEIHCPPNNRCITTLYKFRKYFSIMGQSQLVFHYYCSNCIYPVENRDSVCDNCGEVSEKSFFIEFPLKAQISSMCERTGFYEDLQYRFTRTKKSADNIEDIYDGALYRKEFDNNGFLSNPNCLSLMWYSDGISVFKTSNSSLWPLYFNINELSYKKRTANENLILAGIWFGKKKPNPNLFLKPFFNTLQEFRDVGYEVKVAGKPDSINIKGMLLCGVADLPAKSTFLRFMQYNGTFGCCSCEIPGAREPVGNGTVQVYPYSPLLKLRNNDDIPDLARQALELQNRDPKASVLGVKGPTLLYQMVPNMVRGTAIDVMHGIFTGVSKCILELLVDSSLSGKEFSVYNLLDVVDNRFCEIKPPFLLQRPPKSIKYCLSDWHASDHKYWFFYYSIVVLLGIWEQEYLEHHCKLVSAVYLLSQRSISTAQINIASGLLHSYVQDFQNLYGMRYLGMNVHQLLHFAQCVKDLGPLWVYSCFQFEDKNGRLTRLVHGTRHAGMQIASSASVYLKLQVLIESMPEEARARRYCKQLRTVNKHIKIADVISPEIIAVGKYKNISIAADNQTRNALESFLGIVGGSLKYFCRVRAHGIMYCSAEYRKSKLRDASYACFNYNGVPHLGKVLRFAKWSSCHPECNDQHMVDCEIRYLCISELYERQPWFIHDLQNVHLPYLNRVSPTNTSIAFPIASLETVCFYMNIEGTEYLATPINNLEIE